MWLHSLRSFRSRLKTRAIIHAHGPDAHTFLQGLVTSDLRELIPERRHAVHTAFLNPRGRVAFDALMYIAPDSGYYLDVQKAKLQDFLSHLRRYKLRAKVRLDDLSEEKEVWAVVGHKGSVPGATSFKDPRLNILGLRAICAKDSANSLAAMHDVGEVEEKVFDGLRVMHGIAEGTTFEGGSLPLEYNLDLLDGSVSFTKGCYLGQELTARSHHTGVLRKRLVPVVAVSGAERAFCVPEYSQNGVNGVLFPKWISEHSKKVVKGPLKLHGVARPVGTVRESIWNMGLAVVRLESVFGDEKGQKALITGDGTEVVPLQPHWWRRSGEPNAKAEQG